MSTRSIIASVMPDGEYRAVYCHFDGHPDHNGRILQENYDTQEKVDALLDLGDLSVLAPSVECPEGHSYKDPVKGFCIAYRRDRGEDAERVKAEVFVLANSILKSDRGQEFTYLWDGSKWLVSEYPFKLQPHPLADFSLESLS